MFIEPINRHDRVGLLEHHIPYLGSTSYFMPLDIE